MLTVIALVLLAGVIFINALSSPLSYEVTLKEGNTTETVVESTTVSSFSVSETTVADPVVTDVSEVTTAETTIAVVTTAAPGIDSSGKVNLNTASLEDLKTLNGIGDSKAQAILDYRTENGPFASIEELTNVSGIGQKTFENLQDSITVN